MLRLLPMAILTVSILFFTACEEADNSDNGDGADTSAVTIEDEGDDMEGTNRYNLDLGQSEMMWLGNKPTGQHYGTIELDDSYITVDNGNITGGEIRVDMSTLQSTDPLEDDQRGKLEADLREERFFDADNYQYATLQITSATPYDGEYELGDEDLEALSDYRAEEPTHEVTGELTIKDKTNTITFPAAIDIRDDRVSATTLFKFNRKDWDLRYKGDAEQVIADDIYFGFDVEATN